MTILLTILYGLSAYAEFLERGLAIFGGHIDIGRDWDITLQDGLPKAPRSDEGRHAS